MTAIQLIHLLKTVPPDYPVSVLDTDEDTHKRVERAQVRGLGVTLYTGDYVDNTDVYA